MDRRLVLLPLIAVLAVPATASAASVKIGPKPVSVSASSATIEVANPTRHALRGTATVTAGSAKAASRRVRLGRRSVTDVTIRFSASGVAAVRAAGGRATVKLALKRAGGRKLSARRRLTLRLGSGGANPAPGGTNGGTGGGSNGGTGGGSPQGQTNAWVGRMGTEGAYDDLEFTLVGGVITITKTPLVPVYCFENGAGHYLNALSLEPFVVPGPWHLGADESVQQSGAAVNRLVSAGSRSITYKVSETAATATTVTGKLGISYFDSKYDIFANQIWFVNCSGTQSFEAIPAA
jgi:hypothetical protein